MQYFLKLIETARKDGIFINDKYGKATPRQATEDFWTIIENCQPFVFSKWTESKSVDWNTPDGSFANLDLDAPFRIFSIETMDPKGLVNLGETVGHKKFTIRCVLVMEMGPRQFGFYTYLEVDGYPGQVYSSNSEGDIVKAYVERINKEATGLQSVRHVVKIGSSESKRTHRIRKIIYVCPKKEKDSSVAFGSRQIDWTHRFLVRGHWRVLNGGLGKDREGNYCVSGFTWVSEHEKGPEGMPLVTKTRLVK